MSMTQHEAWKQVMKLKNKETRTRDIRNTLKPDEINTIIATMDFFGAHDNFLRQTISDLTMARFRVFDWIAMCLDGRCTGYGDDTLNIEATKVIAHSFLKSEADIDKWIEDLRITDYQIDQSYTRITWEKDGVNSMN